VSVLERVAEHERALLGQRDDAKREAGDLVAAARLEARRILEEAERDLETEVTELRREAEAIWSTEQAALRQETEQKMAQTRAEAATKAPAVTSEIVSLILPAGHGGGGS
jgi:vacuolar-type H+-ATPase subunit H